MRTVRPFWNMGLWAVLIFVPSGVLAQGTLDDYRRAAGLDERFEGLVVDAPSSPSWIGETTGFWYRKMVPGGVEFMRVDAATQEKRAAFDHARLASSLSAETDSSFTALELPLRSIEFTSDGGAIEFEAVQSEWRCDLSAYRCERLGAAEDGGRDWDGRRSGSGRGGEDEDEPVRSPDDRLEAFVQNYNVVIRDVGSDEVTVLSRDGSEGNAYALRSIRWSPDSRKLAAYRVVPGYQRAVHYIESSPSDQLQPKHFERTYTKPGDVLDVQQPVLFDVASNRQIAVDDALFPNPYALSPFEWREDGRAVTFEYNERGHQLYRVIEVDVATGATRTVIAEEPETFFSYRPASGNPRDSGKHFRYDVDDGREVIWMSERDGWNHLYLYDGATGRVKHQITEGEWVVRAVDHVDEENRQIWFRASGMDPDQDPYFVHYYRIDFDGGELVALTDADGHHDVEYSSDREYYVDTWSRVDQPPIMQLRRTSDRAVLTELERADASALLETGWRPPEVFVAKGRDGETDIWGIIVRPMNFDPDRSYPVIESIYAGPQGSFTPKTFSPLEGMQSLAELGFIVVQMDGMGTNNRSKAFHDVAWQNLGDAGLPDRVLWHRAVAEKYAHYDASRVGIYGGSAGGQSALGALLFHPEFYSVAVASVGCHDNRMDKIWWNEHWMGWPLGPHYEASSNVVNAHKLEGKLLLVVGELDTNVDPASTLQVADALIRADKAFDLLFIPGAGHGSGGEYGARKRNDFFVRHLLGVDPPDWNHGATLAGDEDDAPLEQLDFPDLQNMSPSFFDHSEEFRWWARP